MRSMLLKLFLSSALIAPSLAAPLAAKAAPRTETIYQFPNPTWLENIFATRNGSLLTSTIGVPELNLVNPFAKPTTASLVHSFPDANSVFGISELDPNTFAVIAGNYDSAAGTSQNYTVWKVDLKDKKKPAKITLIANVPEAKLLNGMTSLNDHIVLIADSGAGHVLKLDTKSGKYNVVIDHPSMKVVKDAGFNIGINGIKLHGNYLYYTSSTQGLVNRVKIDRSGRAVGSFETIASNVTIPDDFAVTEDGSVILARPIDNIVQRIRLNGKIETVGNLNSTTVAGATSVTLGRTKDDKRVAYVATNGGMSGPVNGTFVEGGKVVAVTFC